MADRPPYERLQPTLFDRLCDDKRGGTRGSPERRFMSLREFRESVVRDLEWLLNSENLGSVLDLSGHPEAARSVVNYGIASFSGKTISNTDLSAIEQSIRDSILCFEPRIDPRSLEVRILADQEASHNKLTLTIGGNLWAEPAPQEFILVTEVDLETGAIQILEGDREKP